jgi:energy-coupling factor transporter ATP-binding protein EcfA2
MRFAEPMSDDEMNALIEEQGKVQERIDALDLWNLDNKIEVAMDALRLPPGDAGVKHLSGGEKRRVALCRVLLEQPDMLLLDEPTNHLDAESVAWLEKYLAEFPGTVVAITHDRYFLDNVAKWILELDRGRGVPYEGNYSGWLEQKQARLAQEEKWPRRGSDARARAGVGAHGAARAPGQEQGAPAEVRGAGERGSRTSGSQNEIVIPPAPRLGNDVVIAEGAAEGYGDKLLFDGLTSRCRAAASWDHRSQRGRQDDAVPHDHRAGAARRGHAHGGRDGESSPTWTRAARWTPRDRVGGDLRRPRDHPGRQEGDEHARLPLELQLQGHRPAEEGRPTVGGRAQPAAPGEDGDERRQPAAARRADQRPGRRHAARAGGGAGGLPAARW